MAVLITGAYGRVGTAVLDHHSGQFQFVRFDKRDHPLLETVVGDITTYSDIEGACSDCDSVVHLAGEPHVDADWGSVLHNNIIGGYNCLEACRQCDVESVVLASSNHVVGMYEQEHAPQLYSRDYDLVVDHESPIRPDSLYGTSKAFLEALGRYYVENYEYPKHVYALRIGSVRYPEYDHPFGDAEAGIHDGRWNRDSPAYKREVRRMKATWHSRRDAAALVECCLSDDSVTYANFYGVSDNSRRWFDINHAQSAVGYTPQDSADDWEAPPTEPRHTDSVAFNT